MKRYALGCFPGYQTLLSRSPKASKNRNFSHQFTAVWNVVLPRLKHFYLGPRGHRNPYFQWQIHCLVECGASKAVKHCYLGHPRP